MAASTVTAAPLVRSPINRLLIRFLGYDASQPDVVKWVTFAKNLLLIFSLSVCSVWGFLTYGSITNMRRILNASLTAQGRALARTAAHAAFVPLSLRDEAALKRLLTYYEQDVDVVAIEVAEKNGPLHVSYTRSPALGGRSIEVEISVSAPAEYDDIPAFTIQDIGRVRVWMSTQRIDAEMRATILDGTVGSVALLALVLVIGLILIRDMTERLRKLVGEAGMAEKLRISNAELEQFAFVASHDLQAPLRTVASFVMLLKRRYQGKLDAEADEFINAAVGGAERMQILIHDLLAFSKIGRTDTVKERCDLEAVFRNTLEILKEPIRESAAIVVSEGLPTVMAIPLRMGQLMQNLIGNAIKYRGKEHPRIRVWARRRKAVWEISVQDNGIGIDPQYYEKVFIIFQRLHSRKDYPGTGIGLAICKKIVEHHGGRLWVESEPGAGSTFRFTLPAGV